MRASPPVARLLFRRLCRAMSSADAAPAKAPRLADALRVKKLSADATLPVRGSAGAAGYDLARCAPRARASRGRSALTRQRHPPRRAVFSRRAAARTTPWSPRAGKRW